MCKFWICISTIMWQLFSFSIFLSKTLFFVQAQSGAEPWIPHIIAFLTPVTQTWFVQRPKALFPPCLKREKEKWPLFRSEFAEGKPFALCEWFKSQWVWFIVFSQTSIICKNSTWFWNKGPVSSSIESFCSVAVITGAFSVSLLLGPQSPSLSVSESPAELWCRANANKLSPVCAKHTNTNSLHYFWIVGKYTCNAFQNPLFCSCIIGSYSVKSLWILHICLH